MPVKWTFSTGCYSWHGRLGRVVRGETPLSRTARRAMPRGCDTIDNAAGTAYTEWAAARDVGEGHETPRPPEPHTSRVSYCGCAMRRRSRKQVALILAGILLAAGAATGYWLWDTYGGRASFLRSISIYLPSTHCAASRGPTAISTTSSGGGKAGAYRTAWVSSSVGIRTRSGQRTAGGRKQGACVNETSLGTCGKTGPMKVLASVARPTSSSEGDKDMRRSMPSSSATTQRKFRFLSVRRTQSGSLPDM